MKEKVDFFPLNDYASFTKFVDRIGSFIWEALQLKYSYNEAWKLLLESEQGRGILSADGKYLIDSSGGLSAYDANNDIGNKFIRSSSEGIDLHTLKSLATLIWIANVKFRIPFSQIFSKTSLRDFMEVAGNALGRHDSKLIKAYLI